MNRAPGIGVTLETRRCVVRLGCAAYSYRDQLKGEEMTLEQFNSQYPSSIPIEELAIINEIESSTSAIPAGRTVKRVTGGRPPTG